MRLFTYSIHKTNVTFSQRLEWEATVARRPPCKTLTADELPGSGKTVPHRLYGWPISEDYMLDYARRHKLIFPVDPYYRDRFDGKDEFNFGDLTDDHLADKHLFLALRRSATMRVLFHFSREVHARWMTVDRPISLEWDKMLVLWSTDDYEKQYTIYDRPGKWERVKKFIDDALNECLPEGCERRTSLAWWWSFENSLVSSVLSSLFDMILTGLASVTVTLPIPCSIVVYSPRCTCNCNSHLILHPFHLYVLRGHGCDDAFSRLDATS